MAPGTKSLTANGARQGKPRTCESCKLPRDTPSGELSEESVQLIVKGIVAALAPLELLKDIAVAAKLNIGKSTVWQWAAEGRIPQPVHIGKAAFWKSTDINRMIQEL